MTFCILMSQLSNYHLFLLVSWGARGGHLSDTWLIFELPWEERWPGRKNLPATLDLQVLEILHSWQNGACLNGDWEMKENFKERSQNTWGPFMAKLRGKTPMFICVIQGCARYILRVEILSSPGMKAHLWLRSELLRLPLRYSDAQQEPFAGVPSKQDLIFKMWLTAGVLNFTRRWLQEGKGLRWAVKGKEINIMWQISAPLCCWRGLQWTQMEKNSCESKWG